MVRRLHQVHVHAQRSRRPSRRRSDALTSLAVSPSRPSRVRGGPGKTVHRHRDVQRRRDRAGGPRHGRVGHAAPLPTARYCPRGGTGGRRLNVYAIGGIAAAGRSPSTESSTAVSCLRSVDADVDDASADADAAQLPRRRDDGRPTSTPSAATPPARTRWPRSNATTGREHGHASPRSPAPRCCPRGRRAVSGEHLRRGRRNGQRRHLHDSGDGRSVRPATNAWTTKAPMPAAAQAVGRGAIDGILYAVGGSDGTRHRTLEAYNPGHEHVDGAERRCRARSPYCGGRRRRRALRHGRSRLCSLGRLRVRSVADAWSARTVPTGRGELGAAVAERHRLRDGRPSRTPSLPAIADNEVETFVDSLRWSSSAPAIGASSSRAAATPLHRARRRSARRRHLTLRRGLRDLHRRRAVPTDMCARPARRQPHHDSRAPFTISRLGAQPRRADRNRRRYHPRLRVAGRRRGDLPRRRDLRRLAPRRRRDLRRAVHQLRVHADGAARRSPPAPTRSPPTRTTR